MAQTAPSTPVTSPGPQPGRNAPFEPADAGLADARFCRAIAARHARTFSLASRLLPPAKRRAAYAIYATCRRADDLVDLSGQGDPDAREALARFRKATFNALAEPADDPVLRELARAVSIYGVSTSALAEVFDGVAMDLEHDGFADWTSLLDYCEAVAGSVGEMTCAIFGIDPAANGEARSTVVASARMLGVAMQLTNILRDVGEDATRGRCYLPTSELADHGLTRAQVLDGSALLTRHQWESFMKAQVSHARSLYREAMPAIALLAQDAQRCAAACAHGYATILDAIEAARHDTFTSRVSASRLTLLGVAWQSWRGRAPTLRDPGVPHEPEAAR